MRYVVLDTDVASHSIRQRLHGPLATKITGYVWCVTFVTAAELWQWASIRSWGPRTRDRLQRWVDRVLILHSDDSVSGVWGRTSAAARLRGLPQPVNDSWIAACCLAYDLPLATLNLKDFTYFKEHEGLQLISE